MGTESKIPVTGTGKDLRTVEHTTTAGKVHTEAVFIADPCDVDQRATVVGNGVQVALPQVLSTDNTIALTSADASPGSPWVGTWELTRSIAIVRELIVLASTRNDGGTFTFEFSETGTEVALGDAPISESRTIGDFDTVRDFDLINAGAYFRCAFEPATALGAELVFVTTTLRKQNDGQFVRLADQEIERQNAALPSTFSYLKAFGTDGKSRNLTLDDRASLNVNVGATVATFGDLVTTSRKDQLTVNFAETTPENKVAVTEVGTGNVTNVAAQSIVASGTTAASSAKMQTRRTVQYRPSHELYSFFTATFSEPSADGYQRIGLFDDDNGFFIAYEGTTFCICRRDGGVDYPVDQVDWNGELETAFTRDGVVEALNYQAGNVYRIRFGWLGNAPIRFEVISPDGQWILLHSIKYPNTSVTAHIENPNIPLRSEVGNGAGTDNVSIATSSWSAGATIAPQNLETIYQKRTPDDAALPSGSAITVDLVMNTEPNVFDSGWIAVTDEYPGGQLLTLQADTSLNVYLLNASDDLGNNMEGQDFYAIQTFPNAPSVSGAPFFDDYFRVIIENTSGVSATTFTVRSQGFGSAPAPVYSSINSAIFDFIPAPLNRSVIAGKTPNGGYANAPTGGTKTLSPVPSALGISGVYTSDVIDTELYPTVLLFVKTDQPSVPDGVRLEWSDTLAFTTIRSQSVNTFRTGNVAGGLLIPARTRLRYLRVKYTNGVIAQSDLFINLRLSPIPLVREVELKSSTAGQTGQVDVTTTAVQAASGALSGRKTLRLKNLISSARPLFYGFTQGVTAATGDELAEGESIDMDIDEFVDVYVVTTSGGGTVRASWTEIA